MGHSLGWLDMQFTIVASSIYNQLHLLKVAASVHSLDPSDSELFQLFPLVFYLPASDEKHWVYLVLFVGNFFFLRGSGLSLFFFTTSSFRQIPTCLLCCVTSSVRSHRMASLPDFTPSPLFTLLSSFSTYLTRLSRQQHFFTREHIWFWSVKDSTARGER
jgi:hypothetical protein